PVGAAPPVDQYLFEEGTGTTVHDTGTPGGNDGTLVGAGPPTFVPGPSGQAGDFALNFTGSGIELQQLTDLTNGAVQLKQNLAPILGATGSLIAWIKTVQTSTTGNHWSSPAITGSEHPGAADDISWGWLD